jgi:glycosyltransferase involved in cell wall biosynthesis
MPKVSVIIPAFNAERFIRDTIDSALAQTHRDVAVIVVDDSSTDDTADVLRGYGSRITVHRQPNGGAATARNTGASLATGEWLAFLDADDLWLPEKLERQLALQPAAFASPPLHIGDRGALPRKAASPRCTTATCFARCCAKAIITSSSVMVRRDVFQRLGGFSRVQNAEDWDSGPRREHHPVSYCPEPSLRYRFHAGGKSCNHRKTSSRGAAWCRARCGCMAAD